MKMLALGLGLMFLMGLCGLLLPSCSPAGLAAARAIPLETCVVTGSGTFCYSSKAGLSARIDARGGK